MTPEPVAHAGVRYVGSKHLTNGLAIGRIYEVFALPFGVALLAAGVLSVLVG